MKSVRSRIAPVTDWLSVAKEHWRARYVKSPSAAFLFELLIFGIKQAWACLFGALFLGALLLTHLYYPAQFPLARYDFLVLLALGIQCALIGMRLESWEEARIIFIFHVVGTIMEIFKTSVGSWTYPEPNLLRLGGVPLFSGFMYACVGSYIARIWRILDFHFEYYPSYSITVSLAACIYANFFTHHYIMDARWIIFAVMAVQFRRCTVVFRIDRMHRRMPLLVGFLLVALFIWFAENIATFSKAWIYPSQQSGWAMVSLSKLPAWYLLMFISFVLVSMVHRPRPAHTLAIFPLFRPDHARPDADGTGIP